MDSPPSNAPASSSSPAPTAPAVLLVLVTHDPGPWFDETLASIAEQDYPALSVLVIDTASAEDPAPRVRAVLPDAHVRRLDEDPGYSAATDLALEVEDRPLFYAFCHDDVALEPRTIRLLLEEMFRSNAGVVGPKLVDWHDPRRLLQVGMSADKTGAQAPLVDRGELDQEQHDAVRDVFWIPGGCTVVRADLFRALGGFDRVIAFLGEDLDLCWRAHVAGARVMVVPTTRVRHLEALGTRRPVDDRRRLQTRHRLRTMLSTYTGFHLMRVLPQAVLFSVVEVLVALVLGRTRQVRDVWSGWTWNLRRTREIRARRRDVRALRRVRDREVRRLQVRGSARATAYLRGQIGGDEEPLQGVSGVGRSLAVRLRDPGTQRSLLLWAGVLVLFVVGSRHLITRSIPNFGEFVDLGPGPGRLLEELGSSFRDSGLGYEASAPTALGVLGFGGYALLGATGMLRTLSILGLVPLGLLGAWRLLKPVGSRRARMVAVVAYAAVPVAYNSVTTGHWSGLVAYAAAPWILGQLARLLGAAPYGPEGGEPGPGVGARTVLQRVLALGVVTALAVLLVPALTLVVVLLAAAVALGSLLVGRVEGTGRLLAGAVAASGVALVLHFPWTLALTTSGWDAFGRPRQSAASVLDLGELMRFDTGELGSSLLGWAVLVAAVLALLIGRGWRLAWAVRGWFVALGCWFVALAGQQGWLPVELPPVEVLLAPAAAGLVLAVAMGMVAFEVDLPDYHFGWRQVTSVIAGAALVLAVLPVVGDALIDGRWGAPDRDLDRTLAFLDTEQQEVGPFRTLWVGDPDVVPMSTWVYDDAVGYTTSSEGLPVARNLFPGDPGGVNDRLRDALDAAARGETTRLGEALAPMGIRYLVLPLRRDPGAEVLSLPASPLTASLSDQLDLAEVEVSSGLRVWENDVWVPVRADGEGAPVLVDQQGFADFAGDVADDSVVDVAAGGESWRLRAAGTEVPGTEHDDWRTRFEVTEGGAARLTYAGGGLRTLGLVVGVLLWVIVLVLLARGRAESATAPTRPDGRRGRERRT